MIPKSKAQEAERSTGRKRRFSGRVKYPCRMRADERKEAGVGGRGGRGAVATNLETRVRA